MEEQSQMNGNQNNGPVELHLMGIDKLWVRSNKGSWEEKREVQEMPEMHLVSHEPVKNKSKWMFWKK